MRVGMRVKVRVVKWERSENSKRSHQVGTRERLRRRRRRRRRKVYSGTNAVNGEDPERDRATQV